MYPSVCKKQESLSMSEDEVYGKKSLCSYTVLSVQRFRLFSTHTQNVAFHCQFSITDPKLAVIHPVRLFLYKAPQFKTEFPLVL